MLPICCCFCCKLFLSAYLTKTDYVLACFFPENAFPLRFQIPEQLCLSVNRGLSLTNHVHIDVVVICQSGHKTKISRDLVFPRCHVFTYRRFYYCGWHFCYFCYYSLEASVWSFLFRTQLKKNVKSRSKWITKCCFYALQHHSATYFQTCDVCSVCSEDCTKLYFYRENSRFLLLKINSKWSEFKNLSGNQNSHEVQKLYLDFCTFQSQNMLSKQ